MIRRRSENRLRRHLVCIPEGRGISGDAPLRNLLGWQLAPSAFKRSALATISDLDGK
jgi:hypothetical protein